MTKSLADAKREGNQRWLKTTQVRRDGHRGRVATQNTASRSSINTNLKSWPQRHTSLHTTHRHGPVDTVSGGMLCKHYIKLRRQARKNIAHLSGHQRYLGNIAFCPIWPVSTKHYANMEGIQRIHLGEREIENQWWSTKESSRWQCCCSTAVYSAKVENLSAGNKKLSSLVVSASSKNNITQKKV